MDANHETWISRPEAARRLGISVEQMARIMRDGTNGVRLEAVRIGRHWRTTAEALQRFVDTLAMGQEQAHSGRIDRQAYRDAMKKLRAMGMKV